jgi:hypothetical protein
MRKQIIMFLADKASDDGSGIWCSKGTIQRHTEPGETTVKRAVREFLKEPQPDRPLDEPRDAGGAR